MWADTEDQARECIAEQDRPNIKSVNKIGQRYNNFVVTFESHELAEQALKRAGDAARILKNAQGKAPRVEWFRDRPIPAHHRDNSSNVFSSRGGTAAGAGRSGNTSGGERASDSEGGRGRGSAFGRGRGRGDRGRGRGMGAGRGGFTKPDSDRPVEAKPAPPANKE